MGNSPQWERPRKRGVWPDFIAPAEYENPAKGWKDPRLPDFRTIWRVARENGYSIGLHGSMARDCDMIAVPWTNEAGDPEQLIRELCAALNASEHGRSDKPHGRFAVTLVVNGWVKQIDLSIMPRR